MLSSTHGRGMECWLSGMQAGSTCCSRLVTIMMPLLAMVKLTMWTKERGETKQHELIGMSSGTKDAGTKRLAAFASRVKTFEKAGE